jgi:hypothetical protein
MGDANPAQAGFGRMALRDAGIVAAALLLWSRLSHLSAGSGVVGDVTGVLLGLGLGVCGFLAHEWGHLLGALAVRSRVRPAATLRSVYLFSFDSRLNSRRQFLVMSVGGFIVTGALIWAAYFVLPDGELASRVARGVIAALASLTVLIELPLVGWALLRPTLPPVETFASHRREQRSAA